MSSSTRLSDRSWKGRLLDAAFWLVALAGCATYLFARDRMNPLVSAAMVWHVLGGMVLGIAFLISLCRRRGNRGLVLVVATTLFSGLALVFVAAAGISVSRVEWIFAAHLAVGALALSVLLIAAAGGIRRAGMGAAVLMLGSAVAVLAATVYPADDYFRLLTATNARQAGNPLFPAGAVRTTPTEWPPQPEATACGDAGCHAEISRAWAQGRHATSGSATKSPINKPGDSARWCAGCHAVSGLLTASGWTPGAVGSVGCLACHAIGQAPPPTGNGRAVYAPPAEYPFAGWMRGFALRLRPAPHVATLSIGRKLGDSSTACVACHRMSVNAAQNQYKFLRYDNLWADWQAGPYSGQSIHPFQMSPQRRGCVDCHMPRAEAGGTSHACLAEPLSPHANGSLRVELFALRRAGGPASGGERLDAPLANRPVSVTPGEELIVETLVENRLVGHAFPAATESGEQVHLTLTVSTPGRAPMSASHAYGQIALDSRGEVLGAAEKDRMVATAYRRFIAPGEADVAHFRIAVPAAGARSLRLDATLTRSRPGSQTPEVLGEHSVDVVVRSASAAALPAPPRVDDPRDARKFFLYGIGLLRQGDNGRARRAFQQAARLVLGEPLYLVGAARAFLAEHDLLSARTALESALRLRPGLPQALAWLGAVYRESGQFAKALEILKPLSQRYPNDRELWMEMGLCYRQSGAHEEAARAFESALAVDPDDVAAHLGLMDSYLRLKRVSLARREEAIYRILREDEPIRPILEPFYAAHPDARIESLPIHEHVVRPQSGATQ